MSDDAPPADEKISLYVWPHFWNLPSFDIESLAAILYLQLAFRHHNHKHEHHKYRLVECTDPDVSPSGTLPFLVHGTKKVSTFHGIVRYLESLDMGLADEGANKEGESHAIRRAKRVAWTSFVDSQLKDLVNHVLYAIPENYRKGQHTALVAHLPIPSKYYLPQRLRAVVQASLEPSGLWTVKEEEEVVKKHPFDKEKVKDVVEEKDSIIREAFGKEKLVHKARETLDLLAPLLKKHQHGHHQHTFFLSPHPTGLDALIAAHILILSHAPLPNNALLPLLKESYPAIIEHSEQVLAYAFPSEDNAEIRADVQVVQVPHANPVVQLGRSLGRILHSVVPVQA
ncbi:hypothetical protein M408DRAFT_17332 [Serendipita vermifera MAFF 305830]|uniref:Mitochondrial outer membrane transport complex Sam37/metaxin N-terminal domain-containing protein n=1 Tax=Serendipita vermifera MAFF 305830 TaxID=933852 RepID=A0A0C3AZE1_SERVB|nr:hypothetical protein M408DRAFT_17332 [Serendipita vermifera MAFF 305830]